jgi:uridine phosphorylase
MAPPKPIHLRPTADLAERVLLPGDPGRALALAQLLLEGPKMFNHHRGLWGYTGPALTDGRPLTIQSTGMGGPSAAIVLHELIALGARRAIRVGTCGALAETGTDQGDTRFARVPESAGGEGVCLPASVGGECHPASAGGLALGDLVVACEALAADGTSRTLGAGERIAADRELTAALADAANGLGANPLAATQRTDLPAGDDEERAQQAARHAHDEKREQQATGRAHVGAMVASTDFFYEPTREREREWRAAGAVAVEMEAAALFAVGARAGIQVGCVLAVSDLLEESPEAQRRRIGDDALLVAAEAMGQMALSALS